MVPLLLGLVVLIGPAPGIAQTNLAAVRGHVTDPSGAVVPNAKITLTNITRNVSRTAVSNTDGDYEIPYVLPGTYRLTCSTSGFKTFVATDIVIVGNETRRVDVRLEVGSTSTQVTVTAGAAVISTENAQITSGINGNDFHNNPVSDQEFPQAAMLFLPMVQSEGGGFSLSIAGLPPSDVEESMDGIGNDGTVNLVNNLNTDQNLELITTNAPAEFSRPVTFTMTGKSGANAFHGSAQFYEMNSALDARFPTDPTKIPFKTHEGDVEFGGPLKKDRTFFFVDYYFIRIPSSSFSNENVPDSLERQGDFSQISTPVINPYTGAAFPGNIIPQGMISSEADKMQQLYIPTANQGPSGQIVANNFGFFFPHPSDIYKYDSWNARVDHNFSSKHSLYGRYIDRITPYLLAGNFPDVGTWTRNRYHHSVVVSDTYTFSPNLVNNFRWGWALDHIHDGIPELGFTPVDGNVAVGAVGLQGVNPNGYKAMGFPDTAITGVSALTQQPGVIPLDSNVYTYDESLSWAKGRHVAKFGVQVVPWTNYTEEYPAGTYGSFTYQGTFTGNPYADFLLGLPIDSERLNPLVPRTSHAYEMGLYAEDAFRITPKLTLNYGLRWDFSSFASYEDGLNYNWNPISGDVIIPQAALSKVSPLYPTDITVTTGQSVPNADTKLFRPRLGVAYRISSNTVIRGGFGMYTQPLGTTIEDPTEESLVTSPAPFSIAETYINQFTSGQPEFAMPNPFPASIAEASVPSQSVTGYPTNVKNGDIYEFNVTVERETHHVGLSLSYVGTRGRGLAYLAPDTNLPEPSLIPFTQSRRPFPQFVDTEYLMENGESDYDGLLLTAKRRVGNFTFDANYTYANNMDNMENLQNPYNLNPWNHDAYTPRNVANLMFVYLLPFGRGQRFGSRSSASVNAILGGWHLNWITTLQGGQYFTPSYSGSDPSNTDTFGGIPDRICNGNIPSSRNFGDWFNAACFTVPAAGTFGNSGANILEAPGEYLNNMSLGKEFPMKEGRITFTIEAQALDLFNTPTFELPYSNISVPSQVGRVYAPLGGLSVGGNLVVAGGARAIVLTGRVAF